MSAPAPSDADHPETQNQYVTLINKKIRALKKKVKNIQEIEKKVANKEPINAQQKDVLANKDTSLKALQEFEAIRTQFLKIESEEAQKQEQEQKQPTPAPQPVQQQQETQTHKEAVDERSHVILLLKLVQASKLLDPSQAHGIEARQTLLVEKAGSPTIADNADFDKIHWLTNAIFNIPADKESLERSLDYAMRFLASSDDEFVPSVTYKQLRDELDEINSSSIFGVPTKTEEPAVETTQEAQPTEAQPEVAQEEAQEPEQAQTTGEEEQFAEEGTAQAESADQGFSTREYKRGGRGRGRGGRGGRGARGGQRGGQRSFEEGGRPPRVAGDRPERTDRPERADRKPFEGREGGQRRGGSNRGSPRPAPQTQQTRA